MRLTTVTRAGLAALLALLSPCACADRAPAEPPVLPAGAATTAVLRAELDSALGEVRAAPASAPAWRALGEIYHANGFEAHALACYDRAVELADDDARCRHYQARARAERGDLEGAVEAAERACALAPSYGPARSWLGRYLLELERFGAAAAAFAAADELDPANPAGAWGLAEVALARGDGPAALAALAALESRGADHPYSHHLRASAHRVGGDAEAAAREAELAGEPGLTDAWALELELRRADAYGLRDRAVRAVAAGDLAEAERLLAALRDESPADVNAACMLIDVLLARGRAAEAPAELERARKAAGAHYRLDFEESLVREALGEEPAALAAIEACCASFSEYGPAHLRRGRLLLRAGRHAEGLAALDEARSLGEDGAELHLHRGRALGMLGRHVDAAEEFAAGARRFPGDALLHLGEAESRANLGDALGAWSAWEAARRADSRHPLVLELRNQLEALLGPPALPLGGGGS